MADNYDVKVVSKLGSQVELELRIRRFDSLGFPSTPSFGLMLLWESTYEHGGVLGTQVSMEQLLDTDWMTKNAAAFVTSVVPGDFSHLPVPAMVEAHSHREWRAPESWPRLRLTLEVTDEAWLAPLEVGASWTSRA